MAVAMTASQAQEPAQPQVPARKTFTSLNPATGQPIASFPVHQREDADMAVSRAREAARWWGGLGWRERRPPMDPVRYVSARLLDDVAYSIGVWQGCVRHRTAAPLLPRLTWRAPGGGRSGTGAGAGTGAAGGPRARDPRGPLAAIYGYAARAARRSRPVPAGPESPPGHR